METSHSLVHTPTRRKPYKKKTTKCCFLLFYDCVLFIGIIAAIYPVYILNLELESDSLHNLAEIKNGVRGLSSDEPYLFILNNKGQPIDMINFILKLVQKLEVEKSKLHQSESSMDKQIDYDINAKEGEFIESRGEFIFLLDRSGSMEGQKISMVIQSVLLFIKSLPTDSIFNIISFGSSYERMFPVSVRYDNVNIEQAINQINGYKADMGGTELYEALYDVLSQSLNSEYPRNLYLLTDGEVSSPGKVINLVESALGNIKINAIGIGEGVNRDFIIKLVNSSKGYYHFVNQVEELNRTIIEALKSNFLASSSSCLVNTYSNDNTRTVCISNKKISAQDVEDYMKVVTIQHPSGYWQPDQLSDIIQIPTKHQSFNNIPQSDEIWTTLVALAYLESSFQDNELELSLVIKKAKIWLINRDWMHVFKQ